MCIEMRKIIKNCNKGANWGKQSSAIEVNSGQKTAPEGALLKNALETSLLGQETAPEATAGVIKNTVCDSLG